MKNNWFADENGDIFNGKSTFNVFDAVMALDLGVSIKVPVVIMQVPAPFHVKCWKAWCMRTLNGFIRFENHRNGLPHQPWLSESEASFGHIWGMALLLEMMSENGGQLPIKSTCSMMIPTSLPFFMVKSPLNPHLTWFFPHVDPLHTTTSHDIPRWWCPDGLDCHDNGRCRAWWRWWGFDELQLMADAGDHMQGLVTVPFWEYWTWPDSSHDRPYTWWLDDVQWGWRPVTMDDGTIWTMT